MDWEQEKASRSWATACYLFIIEALTAYYARRRRRLMVPNKAINPKTDAGSGTAVVIGATTSKSPTKLANELSFMFWITMVLGALAFKRSVNVVTEKVGV